ncbi:Hypothetical protein PHPALM_7158 [Phytophthora palmivora]|uniref:Chromo domain-containing protein n=1 Tax=Phytophthora palmivora TaxID=4796 RepID=A0A2P4YD17_9STRA|nr:Hypothetical protein PHPALM_7158 [Phytophthora palmivora]
MIPLGSTRRRDREPRRWRYRIQKQHQQAREQVNEKLRDAIQERADRHNETVRPHEIEVGTQIKPVRQFPDRPQMWLIIQDQDRFDFDEALLPDDSWIRDLDNDEYEVKKIVDMRSGKRTRYGRTLREFLVHWKGYDEPTWVQEASLRSEHLDDYLRDRTNRNRFEVMQSHEEP